MVAHCYVRYLGDLSGGQAIGKVVAASYGTEGTAFYQFQKVSDHSAMKQRFRDALDDLPLNKEEQAEVVSEAQLVFDFTSKLLQQL